MWSLADWRMNFNVAPPITDWHSIAGKTSDICEEVIQEKGKLSRKAG